MFDTAYYLHYVLDTENDCHYTDDLMCLSPERYLWHELKEHHDFQSVVFLSLRSGRLVLETFDAASDQFLHPVKKSWFAPKASQPQSDAIVHKTCSPADLKKEDSTLLKFLLDCQQNTKKAKTALVFTADALEYLFGCSEWDAKSRFSNFLSSPSLSDIAIVRLDMNVNILRKTFLSGPCLFSELDSHVREVLRSHAQRPLLTMLAEQLGPRLVDFSSQKTDMFHILMYEALESGAGEDTPAQLEDQAEYLRLCLRTGLGLACAVDPSADQEPLKRSTVYGKLKDPVFRSRLRADAARLRARNSGSSMTDLFHREFGVSTDSSPVLSISCQDELARSVITLTLPEEYLRLNRAQARNLESLRTALTTLWNKPRNPKVCNLVRTACDCARQAAADGDWNTLTDAMTLLSLCARQICADPVLNDNLDEIAETGVELMHASSDHFRQERNFREMYPGGDNDFFHLSKADLAVRLASQTILETEGKKLSALRSSLYNTILYFNDHPLSEKVEQTLRESLNLWKTKLDQAQADSVFFDGPEEDDSPSGWNSYSPYDL